MGEKRTIQLYDFLCMDTEFWLSGLFTHHRSESPFRDDHIDVFQYRMIERLLHIVFEDREIQIFFSSRLRSSLCIFFGTRDDEIRPDEMLSEPVGDESGRPKSTERIVNSEVRTFSIS